jgi:hypothetical protein
VTHNHPLRGKTIRAADGVVVVRAAVVRVEVGEKDPVVAILAAVGVGVAKDQVAVILVAAILVAAAAAIPEAGVVAVVKGLVAVVGPVAAAAVEVPVAVRAVARAAVVVRVAVVARVAAVEVLAADKVEVEDRAVATAGALVVEATDSFRRAGGRSRARWHPSC